MYLGGCTFFCIKEKERYQRKTAFGESPYVRGYSDTAISFLYFVIR